MKKLLFVMITMFAFMVSCDNKPSLAGSEYTNPNLIADGADDMLVVLKHELDSVKDSLRKSSIAEAEQSAQRQLTAEEIAEIDSLLAKEIDQNYAKGCHLVDSLVKNVKVSAVLTFKDDQHMALRLKTESVDDNSELNYEGTYQLFDSYVILTYEKHRDSLVISRDGKQLYGRLEDDNYRSTLTKTK